MTLLWSLNWCFLSLCPIGVFLRLYLSLIHYRYIDVLDLLLGRVYCKAYSCLCLAACRSHPSVVGITLDALDCFPCIVSFFFLGVEFGISGGNQCPP